MKHFLSACLLLILSTAAASAATCVIVEHQLDLQAGAQVAKLPPVTTPQNITVTGTSAQSAAFSGDTKMIMAWCDTQSAIEIGTNPTASATVSTPMSAGAAQYWRVEPATGLKAAFILRP
jgi:hypothetical protein